MFVNCFYSLIAYLVPSDLPPEGLWMASDSPFPVPKREFLGHLGSEAPGSFSQQALREALTPQGLMWEVFTGTVHLVGRWSFVARYTSVFQMGECLRVLSWDQPISSRRQYGDIQESVTSF